MRAAVLAAAATLAALLLAPAPAEAKLAFRPLTEDDVPPDGFAVWGSTLVAFRQGDGWELWEHDLAKGGKRLLTTVPLGVGTRVADVRLDGEWVVWSDDRTGDREVYALQRSTGALARVTDATGPDEDVGLHAGRIAWVRGLRLQEGALPGPGAASSLNVSFPRSPVPLDDGMAIIIGPDLHREMVAFTAADPDGHVLSKAHGASPRKVRSDGTAIAWTTEVLWNADEPGLGVKGTVIQFAPTPAGPVRNLTTGPVQASSLSLQGGRVCWLQSELLRCHLWQTDGWQQWEVAATAVAASGTHAVLFQAAGEHRLGSLSAASFGGDGGGLLGIPPAGPPLAMLALAAAAAAGRRRGR